MAREKVEKCSLPTPYFCLANCTHAFYYYYIGGGGSKVIGSIGGGSNDGSIGSTAGSMGPIDG